MRTYVYAVVAILLATAHPPLQSMPMFEQMPNATPSMPTPAAAATNATSSLMPVTMPSPENIMPSAPAPMPSPAAPPAPTNAAVSSPQQTAATPSTALPDSYKKEIEDIDKQLAKLNASKATLTSLLSKFDAEIEQSKSLALQSRKKSMDILNQTAPEVAQKIRNEISSNLETIKRMQQSVQNEIITPFTQTINELQTGMQLLQTSMTQAEAQGAIFKKINADALPQQKSLNGKKEQFATWLVPQETPQALPQKTEKTFIHYVFSKVADMVTGALHLVLSILHTIKETVFGTDTKKSIHEASSDQPTNTRKPTAKNLQHTQAAGGSPAAFARNPATPANGVDLKTEIDGAEKIIVALNEQRYGARQQALSTEREFNALQLTLASNQKIADQLNNLDESLAYTLYPSTWKKRIVAAFATVLDDVVFAYNYAYFYIIKMYRAHMVPLVNSIASDVNDQIKENQSSH